jgi:hypothetical protein
LTGAEIDIKAMPQCTANVADGSKPALLHSNMGVCFDPQQRTLSIVFSVAP